MQNERTNQRKLVNPTKKEWRWHVAQFGVGCLLLFFAGNVPVFAAGNVDTSQITGGFDAIYQVIAAIVSSIGTIFLLWGLFEWAQSLNTQDGGAQSIAFKRIGSGLIAMVRPDYRIGISRRQWKLIDTFVHHPEQFDTVTFDMEPTCRIYDKIGRAHV